MPIALWATLLLAVVVNRAEGSPRSLEASQGNALERSPLAWAEVASANEERIINDNSAPTRYRMHQVDAKRDIVRELIEAREGTVARLIARNGQPITKDEDSAERERLDGILRSPDEFLRHTKRDLAAAQYATQLVHLMPQSMIWSYAPNQPQAPSSKAQQVVLDFVPDPKFKPPTLISESLTGVAGRVWIDERSGCLVRIEGHVLHPINFGWGGLLARINEGGTVELEQFPVNEHRWMYSHLTEHVVVREFMLRTVNENAEVNSFDVRTLPAPIGYREAVQELLALPVPTR